MYQFSGQTKVRKVLAFRDKAPYGGSSAMPCGACREFLLELNTENKDAEFVTENIFPQIKAVQKETGIKGKNLFMPIRIAVSGEMHGPELPDTIFLLGRKKSIQHIENMLKEISK